MVSLLITNAPSIAAVEVTASHLLGKVGDLLQFSLGTGVFLSFSFFTLFHSHTL